MNMEYMKYFHEVASMRSISKVANNSHISQPALSQQIQRLEDVLGHKLLVRSNKGVELTESGQIVEKYAKQLLKIYDNMVEDLSAMNNNHITIRIDSNLTLATYALPCTLYSVQEKFPGFNFNLSSKPTNRIEQSVLNDNCDLGFIYGEPEEKELSYTKVGMDRLVVVASEKFNIPSELQLKDLINYKFIMLHEKLRDCTELNKCLGKKGYDMSCLNVSLLLDSTESVKSAVLKGYGLTFVPYISVKKELYTKQLKEIKVVDFDMNFNIYIIFKKNHDPNSGVNTFIDYLKKIGEKSFC